MWHSFSPLVVTNFIAEQCRSSNKESMVAETPVIYQQAKNCVYTIVIEYKLTKLLVKQYSFHTCINVCI